MKTVTLVFLSVIALAAKATDDKFTNAMSKCIEAVYHAQTPEELQKAVNAFDRIADAEKTKWEPLYYSAFGNVMLATREADGKKKDGYLDLALALIEKAKAVKPNDSEIIAIEGFVHTIRVTVDPASRGQEYSAKAFDAYQRALTINPNNPRALALMAQLEFGAAQFFNSPITSACATNQRALEKYEEVKPESPLAPTWGRVVAEELKSKCK